MTCTMSWYERIPVNCRDFTSEISNWVLWPRMVKFLIVMFTWWQHETNIVKCVSHWRYLCMLRIVGALAKLWNHAVWIFILVEICTPILVMHVCVIDFMWYHMYQEHWSRFTELYYPWDACVTCVTCLKCCQQHHVKMAILSLDWNWS